MPSNNNPTPLEVRQNEPLLDNQSDENDGPSRNEQIAPGNMQVLHQQPSTEIQECGVTETLNVQPSQSYTNTSRTIDLPYISYIPPSSASVSHSNIFASRPSRFPFPVSSHAFRSARPYLPVSSNIRPQLNTNLIPDSRLIFWYNALTQQYLSHDAPPMNTFVPQLQTFPSTFRGAAPTLSRENSTVTLNSLPITRNLPLIRQNIPSVNNFIPELNPFYQSLHLVSSPTSHFGIQTDDVEILCSNYGAPFRSFAHPFRYSLPPPRQILPTRPTRNAAQPLEQIVPLQSQVSLPSTTQVRQAECFAGDSNNLNTFGSKTETVKSNDSDKNYREESQMSEKLKKIYQCKCCGKTLSSKNALDQHIRIHTGEKPYVCKECGKKFRENGAFRKHKIVHSREKPYECEVCGKRFNLNGNLTTHYKVHSGEKPYECKECGKKFSQNGTLKKHKLVHTGEKPYECEVCGKKFNCRSNLTAHYKVHSGKKTS